MMGIVFFRLVFVACCGALSECLSSSFQFFRLLSMLTAFRICHSRFTRPPWTTGILIPLSFGCGIIAAILIWKGSERTKKFTEVEKAVNGIIREREEEKKKRRLRIPHPHLPGHHHHEHDEEHPHGDHQKFGLMGRHE